MRTKIGVAVSSMVIASCGYPEPPAHLAGTDASGGDMVCTADLASSADNCGTCGHSCGGGACNLGVCQPVVIPNLPSASSLSVDDTTLYVTSKHQIFACPKSGCVLQPTQLDDMSVNGYDTWAINVTNGSLFFMSAPTKAGTENDDLFRCPLTGCPSPAPILATAGFAGISYLGNAGNDVYYASGQAQSTTRIACAPNNGACDPSVKVLDTAVDLMHLAAREDEFYYADANGLKKCPHVGCVAPATPTLLSSLKPTAIVYFDGLIYMQFGDTMSTLGGAIRTCSTTDCDGNMPKNFLVNRDPIDGLTVDTDGVYWLEDSMIYSCPRTGCIGGPKILANVTRMDSRYLNPHPLVTDDAFVYWIDDNAGTVKRVAKRK